MIYLNAKSGLELGEHTKRATNSEFEIYWEGLLFIPGVKAGFYSAQYVLNSLRGDDVPEGVVKKTLGLRGNWALFIHALRGNSWIACGDHSHQSYLYYSQMAVSSSFLRMRRDVADKSKLSGKAVATFLCTGVCMDSRAFYEGLQVLDYRDYVHVSDGRLRIAPKNITEFFVHSGETGRFIEKLDTIFSSLREERMCVDLTAGADTRSLVICLSHLKYDFDVATEGDLDYSEVVTAKAVASALGKEVKCRDLAATDLDRGDLRAAWSMCDGVDLQVLSYKFETWRKRFGYSLVVSAVAGELYKDAGWYRPALRSMLSRRSTATMIDSMIKSGVLLVWDQTASSEIFSMVSPDIAEQVREWIREIRGRIIATYGGYPPLEASDRLFFNFSINRPGGTRLLSMPRYCPLTEQDLVRIGVNQPVMRRLNQNFYRQEFGRLNPEVASIPTDRLGLTLSPKLRDLPFEWMKYVTFYFAKQGNESLFKNENKNRSVVDGFVLGHDDLKEALINLKDRRIVNPALERPTLNQARRLLMLHYVLEANDEHLSSIK